jgi:hypothetical protein
MDEAHWKSMHALLVEGKFLKAPVDLSQAYTVDYLK